MLHHAFVSTVPDGLDATKVQPTSNWNAEHSFDGGAHGALLYRDTAPGAGASWLAAVATGSVLVSAGVGAAPAWSATPSMTSLAVGDGLVSAVALGFSGGDRQGFFRSGTTTVLAQGGNSLVNFSNAGNVTLNFGSVIAPASGTIGFRWNSSTQLYAPADGSLAIATNAGAAAVLSTEAANTLALRNSTNAQSLLVYNTRTDASNYERLGLTWNTNETYIGNEALGTGTKRNLVVHGANVYFGVGSTPTRVWYFSSSGHLLSNSNNTYDIGASGASQPRYVYAGTAFLTADGSLTAPGFGPASEPGTGFYRPQANCLGFVNGGSEIARFWNGGFTMRPDTAIMWGSTSIGNPNTLLYGLSAGNTLELRNAANAQTFNIYQTFTNTSNYGRGGLSWTLTANRLSLFTEAAGTGVGRDIDINAAGNNVFIRSQTGSIQLGTAGMVTFSAGITHASATMLTTSVALTNGAGAAAGTLTNAPSAGNPTKWVPINDNGTTRYIPAW